LQGQLKYKFATWFMDETYVRVAGRWMYLFRAVDNHGQTVDFYLSETRHREAAKRFLKAALGNRTTVHRTSSPLTGIAAIQPPSAISKPTGRSRTDAGTAVDNTGTTALNPTIDTSNFDSVRCRAQGRQQRRGR
jgi:hypothetical protein